MVLGSYSIMQKLTDVLNMGGYAVYVWPAFGLAFLVMLAMALAGIHSLRRARAALAHMQDANET